MVSSEKSRKYTPRRTRRERPHSLTVASLGALAVVAIGLSSVALMKQADNDSPAEGTGDSVTTQSTPTNTKSNSGHGEEPVDDSTNMSEAVQISERFLAVGDDPNRLVRAEGIECGGAAASIEVTSDAGVTWSSADTSTIEVSGIRALQFGEGGRTQLAFVDESCTLHHAQSYVYGGAWETISNASDVWTLGENPESHDIIVSGSRVKAPCVPIDLANAGESGIVLCKNATVATSNDGGASWSDPVPVDGAKAVTADSDHFDVVSVNSEECAGISARRLAGKEPDAPGSCMETTVEDAQIAAASRNEVLYVWVGDAVMQSNDRGETWL